MWLHCETKFLNQLKNLGYVEHVNWCILNWYFAIIRVIRKWLGPFENYMPCTKKSVHGTTLMWGIKCWFQFFCYFSWYLNMKAFESNFKYKRENFWFGIIPNTSTNNEEAHIIIFPPCPEVYLIFNFWNIRSIFGGEYGMMERRQQRGKTQEL